MNATASERDEPTARQAHMRGSWSVRFFRIVWYLFAGCIFLGAIVLACLQTESLRPVIHEIQSIARGTNIEKNDKSNVATQNQASSPVEFESSDKSPYVETVQATLSSSSLVKRTFTGVIRPAQASELGFNRTGRIIKILVDQGDQVTKDQILARLDSRAIESDINIANSQLKAAQAVLDELKAGPRVETIAAAKEKLKEFKSSVELWKITANRRNRLVRDSAGSQQSVDDARLQLAASEGRYNAQIQVVKELEAGTRQEKIDNQIAVVEGLRLRLDQLAIDLDDCIIRSPFDAIVSERIVDLGVIVTPAHVILKLIQETHPEAWIGLPPKAASRLKAGSSHKLFVEGRPIDATLRSILPELDTQTRTQTAIFAIESKLPNLGFGRIIRFEWSDERNRDGYWLPRTALSHGTRGLWSVFAVIQSENNQNPDTPAYILQRRDVEVVQIESDQVLVRGTIESDDRIVSSGVHRLVANQKVRPDWLDSSNDATSHSLPSTVPQLN